MPRLNNNGFSIGERLKKARKEIGMKQCEIGKQIGIAPTNYWAYESGRLLPSLPNLVQIAKILNVTTDYLLGIRSESENRLMMSVFDMVKECSLIQELGVGECVLDADNVDFADHADDQHTV